MSNSQFLNVIKCFKAILRGVLHIPRKMAEVICRRDYGKWQIIHKPLSSYLFKLKAHPGSSPNGHDVMKVAFHRMDKRYTDLRYYENCVLETLLYFYQDTFAIELYYQRDPTWPSNLKYLIFFATLMKIEKWY